MESTKYTGGMQFENNENVLPTSFRSIKPMEMKSTTTTTALGGKRNVFGDLSNTVLSERASSALNPLKKYTTTGAAPAPASVTSHGAFLMPSVRNVVRTPALSAPTSLSAPNSPKMDLADRNDPNAVTEYVKDIYEYFRQVEGRDAPPPNYMERQTDINEKMRCILVDWLADVHYKFKLLPETLYLTINLIDRFLTKKPVHRLKLQLIGVTALFLAAKYEEIFAPPICDFIYISARAYSKDEILKMERLMLATLNFNLTCPTVYPFLKRFLKAAGAEPNSKRGFLASYFSELALLDYKMLNYLPSIIAAASVYCANKVDEVPDSWNSTLEHYTKYNKSQIMECASHLISLAKNAEKSKMQAVRKKYLSVRRLEVAKYIRSD